MLQHYVAHVYTLVPHLSTNHVEIIRETVGLRTCVVCLRAMHTEPFLFNRVVCFFDSGPFNNIAETVYSESPTPGLHYEIPVFSDPAPGQS